MNTLEKSTYDTAIFTFAVNYRGEGLILDCNQVVSDDIENVGSAVLDDLGIAIGDKPPGIYKWEGAIKWSDGNDPEYVGKITKLLNLGEMNNEN